MTWLGRIGRWATELILVFVGVYAAFWLNAYQEHQRDAKRRDLILGSLEQSVLESLESTRVGAEAQEKRAQEFRRALEAGEMPPVRIFAFVADYSPSDVATLLQAGGVELLDPKTLMALRNYEATVRGGLSLMSHYEKISDTVIVPNIDQDISFFYDPATKKLRKKVEKYPEALEATSKFFRNMEKSGTELLNQIKAERQGR